MSAECAHPVATEVVAWSLQLTAFVTADACVLQVWKVDVLVGAGSPEALAASDTTATGDVQPVAAQR